MTIEQLEDLLYLKENSKNEGTKEKYIKIYCPYCKKERQTELNKKLELLICGETQEYWPVTCNECYNKRKYGY